MSNRRRSPRKHRNGYDIAEKLTDIRFNANCAATWLDRLNGSDLTIQRIQLYGLQKPIFLEGTSGLNLSVPVNLTIEDVVVHVGPTRMLDVMDVETQTGEKMSMKDFARYFRLPKNQRKRLLNVLSLEVSNTPLGVLVNAPAIVRSMDWIDSVWPSALKDLQAVGTNEMAKMTYPKVQKYCLLSVADCFTDFHIDFGGSSVWYNVLQGEKIFWLIRPTEENILRFQEWTLSGQQHKTFFGDLVEDCFQLRVKSGNTVLLPSGWIHAVFTPVDSIVFGGNFLHSFSIPMQLNIYETENNTQVPPMMRFPYFVDINWYAIEKYVFILSGKSFLSEWLRPERIQADSATEGSEEVQPITEWELDGLCVLLDWLCVNLAEKEIGVPLGIAEPEKLLQELKMVLRQRSMKEHNNAITGAFVLATAIPIQRKRTAEDAALDDLDLAVRKELQRKQYNCELEHNYAVVNPVSFAALPDLTHDAVYSSEDSSSLRSVSSHSPSLDTNVFFSSTMGPSSTTSSVFAGLSQISPVFAEAEVMENNLTLSSQTSAKYDAGQFQGVPVLPSSSRSLSATGSLPAARACACSQPCGVNECALTKKAVNSLAAFSAGTLKADGAQREELPPHPPLTKPADALDKRDELWLCVFAYFGPKLLCTSMLVCKSWYKLASLPRFWERICLNRAQFNTAHFLGLIQRQPQSLKLGWTSMPAKHLVVLLSRLERLEQLALCGSSWQTVEGLKSPLASCLRSLDLRWTHGYTDENLKEVFQSSTAIRNVEELLLAATTVSDVVVRYIANQFANLTRLDLSYCRKLSDVGIEVLCAAGTKTQFKLNALQLAGCPQLTPKCFSALRRLEMLERLALNDNPQLLTPKCHLTEFVCFLNNQRQRLFYITPSGVVQSA